MFSSDMTQGSSISEAYQVFVGPVFTEWLRLRRKALTQFDPHWKAAPKNAKRVRALDKAATIWAKFN